MRNTKEVLFGRPVVFAEEDTLISFYCDLFCMVDDWSGLSSVLRTDEICATHFEALKARLQELNHWRDSSVDKILVVGLGDS